MRILSSFAPLACAAMMVYCMVMMRRHGSSSRTSEQDPDAVRPTEEPVGRQD